MVMNGDFEEGNESPPLFQPLREPYEVLTERARQSWERKISELPVGKQVSGEVIGRQAFGVFICIDQQPKALGLAEVTRMPRGMVLPSVGSRVNAKVLWHNNANFQVKLILREWTEEATPRPGGSPWP